MIEPSTFYLLFSIGLVAVRRILSNTLLPSRSLRLASHGAAGFIETTTIPRNGTSPQHVTKIPAHVSFSSAQLSSAQLSSAQLSSPISWPLSQLSPSLAEGDTKTW